MLASPQQQLFSKSNVLEQHHLRILLDVGVIIYSQGSNSNSYCDIITINQSASHASIDTFASHEYPKQQFPINDARLILSSYYSSPSFNSNIPFLILCIDASGNQLYLGTTGQILENSLPKHPFSIKNYGTIHDKNIPKLNTLYDNFNSRFHTKTLPSNHAFAKYDILPKSSFRKESCSISMEFKWPDASSVMCLPSMDSQSCLTIDYFCGNIDTENHASTASLRMQLDILKQWELVRIGELDFPNHDGNPKSRSVEIFLDDIKNMGRGTTSNDSALELNPEVSSEVFGGVSKRHDLDFADLLWNFAFETVSENDLRQLLTAVVEELETSRLTPLINKSNMSSFAKTIREWMSFSLLTTASNLEERKSNVMSTFDFWIENPVECMVEIGIYKLAKDFSHHFMVNNLSNGFHLEGLINHSLSFSEQISNLEKILRTLEISLLISSNLFSMPQETIRDITERAFKYYKDSDKIASRLVFKVHMNKFSSKVSKLIQSVTKSYECRAWLVKIACKEGSQAHLFSKTNDIFGEGECVTDGYFYFRME